MTNENLLDLPIYVDGKKLLIFKVKDYNINLNQLRESLNDIISTTEVYRTKEELIAEEDEEYKEVSQVLINGAIHFITQSSISYANERGTNIFDLIEKGGSVTTDSTLLTNNLTLSPTPSRTSPTPKNDENDKENEEKNITITSLKNIDVEKDSQRIENYCKNLPMKYSIDSETLVPTGNQVVEWDIKNAVFRSTKQLTTNTKSTTNSVEHDAHKNGIYSWNGTLALKSIVNATHKGQIEKEQSKTNGSKVVYSYTHCMVSRLEIRINPDNIKLTDSTIRGIDESLVDLDQLKQFLLKNELFPTKFTLGGKISATDQKKDSNNEEINKFGLDLENNFKVSLQPTSSIELGANVKRDSSNNNKTSENFSHIEKEAKGGNVALKDDFDKYILSLNEIEDCEIIEYGNFYSILDILKIQNKPLHEKCIKLLNTEVKKILIEVQSSVKTKNSLSYSKFIIDGKTIDFGSDIGYNVMVLDSKGNALFSKSFDTSSLLFFINGSKKLARFLNDAKNGSIIIISVNGNASGLKDEAEQALKNLGIDGVDYLSSKSSFCAILKKGDKSSVKQNITDNGESKCSKSFEL